MSRLGAEAFKSYLGAQVALRALMGHIPTSNQPATDELCRVSVVLVCAAFEGFLRSIGQEHVDGIVGAFDSMTEVQKVTVAATAADEINRLGNGAEVDDVRGAERLAAQLGRLASWFSEPGSFAKSGAEPRLAGFWDPDAAPKVVERLLVKTRSDGKRFFAWMAEKGIDEGSLWVTLEQLVRLRNDVAHGERLLPPPTHQEVRTYRARVHLIVRRILAYSDAAPVDAAMPTGKAADADEVPR